MKSYAVCPCCSNKLIHHIGNHHDYWFCRRCWQKMPPINLKAIKREHSQGDRQINIAAQSSLIKPDQIKFKTT
ncbi:MAG TPA: hypothetical protein V6C71_02060 [Coleofasciculaceae cyanobacterium]|jgi:tRNA(Ile2) C34 agmatinyltransferase TiaS